MQHSKVPFVFVKQFLYCMFFWHLIRLGKERQELWPVIAECLPTPWVIDSPSDVLPCGVPLNGERSTSVPMDLLMSHMHYVI